MRQDFCPRAQRRVLYHAGQPLSEAGVGFLQLLARGVVGPRLSRLQTREDGTEVVCEGHCGALLPGVSAVTSFALSTAFSSSALSLSDCSFSLLTSD